MSDDYKERIDGHKSRIIDAARRRAEMLPVPAEPPAVDFADELETLPGASPEAFSTLSADRQRKVMVEFRRLNGNAKALAYSYLVSADFDPSKGITLDFSGYSVTITGRNLRSVFHGLVTQRASHVSEMDELHADAEGGSDAPIVTGIEIKAVE
jgi:hypothetical protein